MTDHSNTKPMGINCQWRVYKYDPGGVDTFAPHIDAGFPGSGLSGDGKELLWDVYHKQQQPESDKVVLRLKVLMYLNDDFKGGCTSFFTPKHQQHNDNDMQLIASVKPRKGSILVFDLSLVKGSKASMERVVKMKELKTINQCLPII